MDRDFLGRGWRFPPETTPAGDVALSAGADDVEESIRTILGTAKGERVMRPEFGCGIHDHAFAAVDASTLHLVESIVEEDLSRFEPRIEVQDVTVSTEELSTGTLLIRLEYRIPATNDERNLVYPFYLEEG